MIRSSPPSSWTQDRRDRHAPAEVIPSATPAAVSDAIRRLGRQCQSLEPIYTDELKLDDYLQANYVRRHPRRRNLYISRRDSQRKGGAGHSLRSCLPGGGWQMRDFGQSELPGTSIGGLALRVNRSLFELGNHRQLVYYWFQQRGRVIDNEFAAKWCLFWDAFARHRTDGAMVRLVLPIPSTADEADADRRLTDVTSRFATELPRYVPHSPCTTYCHLS